MSACLRSEGSPAHLRLGHTINEDAPGLGQDGRVGLQPRRLCQRGRREHQCRHGPLHLHLLVVQVVSEKVPILCANLEDFVVVNLIPDKRQRESDALKSVMMLAK